MRLRPLGWSGLAAVLVLSSSIHSHADVSSWMAVGGGSALQRDHQTAKSDFAPTLTYSMGVGSSPLSTWVLGGMVRGETMFGLGSDLGAVIRVATGGFARGDWGVALEAGGLWRPWRQGSYGEWPIQGIVTLGSPWGFQLALGTQVASIDLAEPALGFLAAVEIDLLRLTVMRQGATERWWYNPAPAGGHLN